MPWTLKQNHLKRSTNELMEKEKRRTWKQNKIKIKFSE